MTRLDISTGMAFDGFRAAFEKAAPTVDAAAVIRIVADKGSWRHIYNPAAPRSSHLAPGAAPEPSTWLTQGQAETHWQSGRLYIKNTIGPTGPQGEDAALAHALWDRSAQLVGLTSAA